VGIRSTGRARESLIFTVIDSVEEHGLGSED